MQTFVNLKFIDPYQDIIIYEFQVIFREFQ